MSDGVRVWIATDRNGDYYAYTNLPEYNGAGWCPREGFASYLPRGFGINVPPGECREFRLVPVDATETELAGWSLSQLAREIDRLQRENAELRKQPQPVTVSPLALWIADKSFDLAIECLRMGKPLTADDMAKLVEQTVVASREAAARIEGGGK